MRVHKGRMRRGTKKRWLHGEPKPSKNGKKFFGLVGGHPEQQTFGAKNDDIINMDTPQGFLLEGGEGQAAP